jgi:hypothetical protein
MSVSNLSSFAQQCAALFTRRSTKRASPTRKKDHATQTHISQSLAQVIDRLREDRHQKVLVVGSAEFKTDVAAAAPQLQLGWASCNFVDVLAGASNPATLDFGGFDAVICGGEDVAAGYRLALSQMYAANASHPVHWVANDWEFCGGTLAAPAEADDAEVLLFNHFRHFFGIKDALQFRIEIYCGAEFRRFYRILGPAESLTIKVSEYFPHRTDTVAIATFVTHPALTRGRHVRLRVCGDIFWRKSLTTLHGAHEFNRSPDHKFEFRLATADLQGANVVLTLPNYARDIGANEKIVALAGGRQQQRARARPKFVEESVIVGSEMGNFPYVGWKYAGYGGSNWYAMSSRKGSPSCGIIAANHHSSVPFETLTDMAVSPEEREKIAQLRQAGYLLEPYALPVTRADDALRYGFSCDSANPPFRDFIVHCFGAEGRHLGEHRFEKTGAGRIFTDELPFVADNEAVQMVTVTPDFERIGFPRKGRKIQFDFIVEHRQTGDWDVTEGQSCWRNVGLFVPGATHFAGPAGSVIGRTNLFARARNGGGFRTAVVANHASGRLDYKALGHLTLTLLNRRGESLAAEAELPSFSWRYLWLDEILPGLADFAAPGVSLPILATSMDADINCQIVTLTENGAVSLQHMWGY